MLKISILFFVFFSFLLIAGCQKDTSPIIQTPDWLNSYIEDMQDHPYYFGTVVYRYKWKENIVYYISIPVSSCAYCEVYNQSGTKIEFEDDTTFQDFITNRKNEFIVWAWEDNN